MGSRQALIDLSATGCSLPVPEVPSGREWSTVGRDRWAELWQSPQTSAGWVTVCPAYLHNEACLVGLAGGCFQRDFDVIDRAVTVLVTVTSRGRSMTMEAPPLLLPRGDPSGAPADRRQAWSPAVT